MRHLHTHLLIDNGAQSTLAVDMLVVFCLGGNG
jgi:hypothetical protein